jgi:hypothetical protein
MCCSHGTGRPSNMIPSAKIDREREAACSALISSRVDSIVSAMLFIDAVSLRNVSSAMMFSSV